MNIFVGNLPYSAEEADLRSLFENFGQVDNANVVRDRETGKSRGFGFVEMPNDAEGEAAITGLNGSDMSGRKLTVNQARPRTDNRRRDRAPRNDRRY